MGLKGAGTVTPQRRKGGRCECKRHDSNVGMAYLLRCEQTGSKTFGGKEVGSDSFSSGSAVEMKVQLTLNIRRRHAGHCTFGRRPGGNKYESIEEWCNNFQGHAKHNGCK